MSYVDAHRPFLRAATRGVGKTVAAAVSGVTGVEVPDPIAGILVVSVGIAFVWGVCYHAARHGL